MTRSVGNDEIGRFCAVAPEALRAVSRFEHGMARTLQGLAEYRAGLVVILNEKNSRHGLFSCVQVGKRPS